MPVKNKIDTELRKLLLEGEYITSEELEKLSDENSAKGGAWLIEEIAGRGLMNENEILSRLAEKVNIPYVELREISIDGAAVDCVPIKIAWHYQFMPIQLSGNTLTVAVYYPLSVNIQDEIRLQLGCKINMSLAVKQDVIGMMKQYYGVGADTIDKIFQTDKGSSKDQLIEEKKIEKIDQADQDASIIKLVNQIISDAHSRRATDIHIEPYRGQLRFRYRIDGILYDANVPESTKYFASAILSRVKIMANLDIVEKRLPQDGQAIVKIKDQVLDLRVSFIPTVHGESVVIRILLGATLFSLDKIGLEKPDVKMFQEILKIPNGIIFVTGPTGSGKTTTLYASINEINRSQRKIITIEDPVEYEIDSVTQIQVLPQVNFDFAAGLRSILRHDPDVLMVGEVRDLETATIAMRAAMTGHLVLSTLHTNDAVSSIYRLIDMGVEPYIVSSSVVAVMAQRLIRILCVKCKKRERQNDAVNFVKERLKTHHRVVKDITVYRKGTCAKCNQTGFMGRSIIYEIIPIDAEVKRMIYHHRPSDDIKDYLKRKGIRLITGHGWELVAKGITSADEVLEHDSMISQAKNESNPDMPSPAFEIQTSFASDQSNENENRRVYVRLISDQVEISFRLFNYMDKDHAPAITKLGLDDKNYKELFKAQAINISAGGILFSHPLKIAKGMIIDLNVIIRDDSGEVELSIGCLAKVVRVDEKKDGNFLIAVCFLDMTSSDRMHLDEFIKNYKSRDLKS